VIITSVFLLVAAFALLVIGSIQGNPTMLGASLGAAALGALALFAGNASARRIALARGVPPEAVLASRVRRTPIRHAAPAGDSAETTNAASAEPAGPPPIDGYDDMSASEVTRLVSSGAFPDDALSDMLVYEASHRRRRAVLTAIIDVVGPDAMPDTQQAEQPAAAPARRRLRSGRGSSGTGPAAEAVRATRQATLTEDEADDSRFARPEPGAPDIDE
jgi:hypothetical protein